MTTKARPSMVSFRAVDDSIRTMNWVVLQRAILAQLADGPLMKWQLREALHIPEHVILKACQTLRADGSLKVVGKNLDQRKWALASWRAATTARPIHHAFVNEATAVRPTKTPEPVRDSWWTRTDLTRAQFQERAAVGK